LNRLEDLILTEILLVLPRVFPINLVLARAMQLWLPWKSDLSLKKWKPGIIGGAGVAVALRVILVFYC